MKRNDALDFVHTGPKTLAGRFMRRFWQPIYRAEDLAAGRATRIKVMSEHFTLYRGEDGTPHLVVDACPHRGTQLSLGWVEGGNIRCFYHGWVFDGTGQCVEQPAEKEGFVRKVCVASYPLEEYLGVIFAYFGEGEPPALPRFPELEDERLGPLTIRFRLSPANYFQRIENDLDEVHVQYVHKNIAQRAGMTAIPEITAAETEYGIYRESLRDQGARKIRRNCHYLMPNGLLLLVSPATKFDQWSVFMAWRVPVDDEWTMVVILDRLKQKPKEGQVRDVEREAKYPDPYTLTNDIMARKLRIHDVDPDYPDMFFVQDNVVLMGQGMICDRTTERLGRSDAPIVLLRKLWLRELKALAEGKPLKQWSRSPEVLDLGETSEAQLV